MFAPVERFAIKCFLTYMYLVFAHNIALVIFRPSELQQIPNPLAKRLADPCFRKQNLLIFFNCDGCDLDISSRPGARITDCDEGFTKMILSFLDYHTKGDAAILYCLEYERKI